MSCRPGALPPAFSAVAELRPGIERARSPHAAVAGPMRIRSAPSRHGMVQAHIVQGMAIQAPRSAVFSFPPQARPPAAALAPAVGKMGSMRSASAGTQAAGARWRRNKTARWPAPMPCRSSSAGIAASIARCLPERLHGITLRPSNSLWRVLPPNLSRAPGNRLTAPSSKLPASAKNFETMRISLTNSIPAVGTNHTTLDAPSRPWNAGRAIRSRPLTNCRSAVTSRCSQATPCRACQAWTYRPERHEPRRSSPCPLLRGRARCLDGGRLPSIISRGALALRNAWARRGGKSRRSESRRSPRPAAAPRPRPWPCNVRRPSPAPAGCAPASRETVRSAAGKKQQAVSGIFRITADDVPPPPRRNSAKRARRGAPAERNRSSGWMETVLRLRYACRTAGAPDEALAWWKRSARLRLRVPAGPCA